MIWVCRRARVAVILAGAGLFCALQGLALANDGVVIGALGESDRLRMETQQQDPVRDNAQAVGDVGLFEAIENLSATRDRPIFSPSRRPPAVARPAVAQAPPPPSKPPSRPLLSLVGAIAAGDNSIAIFLDETTKAVVRLKSGEEYAGWTLTAVQSREATLQRNELSAVLVLPGPPAR